MEEKTMYEKENVIIEVDVRKFRREQKRAEFKKKLKSGFRKTKDWVVEHKDLVITLTPVIIGGIATVVKVVGKRSNLRKEEELKELYCYDRSLGHYWKLRRELSNQEWLEIDRRKKNGERLSDILSDMNVLD
jgi:hypothetical protein